MISKPLPALRGVRLLSLALNLPGPAALMRLHALGAKCTKLEGPAGDPMGHYKKAAYAQMHDGIKIVQADLKSATGQSTLHALLLKTDVLLTSFRPSALVKLGLGPADIRKKYPQLNVVAIVGSHGIRAEEPGHDLTYLAEHGLVTGLDLPATLYADMAGSLLAVEAVLGAVLAQRARPGAQTPKGSWQEVALSEAARYVALPRTWGLTLPSGSVGGAHPGYRVYPCKDGRVAVAALEPHFAQSLCAIAGVPLQQPLDLLRPATQKAIAAFLARQSRAELNRLAAQHDIPFFCMK